MDLLLEVVQKNTFIPAGSTRASTKLRPRALSSGNYPEFPVRLMIRLGSKTVRRYRKDHNVYPGWAVTVGLSSKFAHYDPDLASVRVSAKDMSAGEPDDRLILMFKYHYTGPLVVSCDCDWSGNKCLLGLVDSFLSGCVMVTILLAEW